MVAWAGVLACPCFSTLAKARASGYRCPCHPSLLVLKEWMPAIAQGEFDASAGDGRLIDGHHHLNCSRRRFAAANGLTILLDRIDPIVHHAAIGRDGGFLFFGGVDSWIAGKPFPFLILR